MPDEKKEETTQQGEAAEEGKQTDLADLDPREADVIRGGRTPMPPKSAPED
jgi:hypothetical protein